MSDRCEQELCENWGGDGNVCTCALFDLDRPSELRKVRMVPRGAERGRGVVSEPMSAARLDEIEARERSRNWAPSYPIPQEFLDFRDLIAEVRRLQAQRQAVLDLSHEGCREWVDTNRCDREAEFILWGKLFPADAVGPRCYEHTAKHHGGDLSHRTVEQSAIFDLRRLRAALGADQDAVNR